MPIEFALYENSSISTGSSLSVKPDSLFSIVQQLPTEASDPLKLLANQLIKEIHVLQHDVLKKLIPDFDVLALGSTDPVKFERQIIERLEKKLSNLPPQEAEKLGVLVGIEKSRFADNASYMRALATLVGKALMTDEDFGLTLELLSSKSFLSLFSAKFSDVVKLRVANSLSGMARLAKALGNRISTRQEESLPLSALITKTESSDSPSIQPLHIPETVSTLRSAAQNILKTDSIWAACVEIGRQCKGERAKTIAMQADMAESKMERIKEEENKLYAIFPELKEILKNLLVSSQHVFVDGPLLGFRKLLALSEAKKKLVTAGLSESAKNTPF